MTLPAPLPRRRPLALLGAGALGMAAVFFVPYLVPVSPAISDAYLFGFNNRAALVLFLCFVTTFAYWSGGLGLVAHAPDGRALDGRVNNASTAPALSQKLLWITLAITAGVTLSFWGAYRGIGAINEGSYLMDRLQHLATGERIYRDFEFIYGPTLLYLPLLLHRWLGLSLVDAYYLAWTLAWVGGVYLLWLTVAWSCGSSPRQNGIYLLAFLGFIFSTVSLGLNYTPLRFVGAPFFAVLTWRTLTREGSILAAVGTALAGSAWVLFYSPEQGIALLLGTLAFFGLFVDRSLPGYAAGLVTLLSGSGLLALLLIRSGPLHYMRGMAAGGYNLPLLPSAYTLVLLGLLLAAGCILVNTWRLRQRGGPLEYLILVSLFALPAAFGRCDPGHIYMNTVGAFLAAWTVISYRPAAGRWMAWSYVASALFLPLALYQANNFFMFPVKMALFSPANPHPGLRRLAVRCLDRAVGPLRTTAMLTRWRTAFPLPQTPGALGGGVLLAPLGYPSTLLLGELPPITNGRYRGLGNVMAPYEVTEKLEELRTHPAQRLLFTADAQCPPLSQIAATPMASRALDRAARRELWMNLQPIYLPHVRHPESLLQPVCAYIDAHYRPTLDRGPFLGSVIWERVPGR